MPPFHAIFCVLKFILYSHMENEIIQHVEAFTEYSSLLPIESIKYWKEGKIILKYQLIFSFKHYQCLHSKDSKGDDDSVRDHHPSQVLLHLHMRTPKVSAGGFVHLSLWVSLLQRLLECQAGRQVHPPKLPAPSMYSLSIQFLLTKSISGRQSTPHTKGQTQIYPNPGKTF